MSAAWTQIKARWSSGWKALSARASDAYAAAVRADPTGTLARVQGFVVALEESRASLERMAAKLPRPPRDADERRLVATWQALAARYQDLAAGLYADAIPVGPSGQPQVGAAPVVLVIGGLAISVVGAAWAVAAYQYAVNLREQTALAERELDARIAASQTGRALQPSTLPAPTTPEGSMRHLGGIVLGGLALVAGALALPALLKR